MANIKELIKRNIVVPSKSQIFSSGLGTVLFVDYNNNTATVEVNNQHGAGTFTLEKVHIGLVGSGVALRNIRIGDRVMVEYTGGLLSCPKITNVVYRNYQDIVEEQRHSNQNCYFDNSEVEPVRIIPQKDFIFDGTLEDLREVKQYNSWKLEEDYYNLEDTVGKYKCDELGITHPITKATIKFTDDGDIVIANSDKANIVIKKDGTLLINSKRININSNGEISISTPKNIVFNCNQVVTNETFEKVGE